MEPPKVPGRTLAWTALLVALVASVAANVAFARPTLGPRLSAGVAPVLVVLAAGLLERVPLAGIRLWRRGLAYLGLGVVIVAAFVTSFEHQYALLVEYGNPRLSAVLLPVAVDGLIVLASVCLTVIAERRRELTEAGNPTKVDYVRMVEQQADDPTGVPMSAHLPAVTLSTVRRSLANISADSEPANTTDAAAVAVAVTEADISSDNRAASAADKPTPPRRTAKRTPTRTPRRSPGADIATAARKLRDRHPEWAVADIARRLGVTDRTVRRHLNGSTPTTTKETQ